MEIKKGDIVTYDREDNFGKTYLVDREEKVWCIWKNSLEEAKKINFEEYSPKQLRSVSEDGLLTYVELYTCRVVERTNPLPKDINKLFSYFQEE